VAAAQFLGQRFGSLGATLQQEGWYLLAVSVMIALPFLISWQTASNVCERGKAFFWQAILIDVLVMAILSISYNLMFGFTGVVSFGHAAFFGLGAYSVGIFLRHLAWPWWLAILGTLLIGVLVALIKGIVGLRIKGLYFALFTLAFAQVFYLLAGNRLLVNLTGAEDGFTFSVPDWLNITKNRLFFYYLTLIVFILAFGLVRRLMNSPTGRVLSALRDNEGRAQMLGYNTFYFKLIAIVLAGVLASSAGILRGLSLKGASPEVLGLTYTFDPLLMTIIGGMGTFAGPVIGAVGLQITEELLRDTVITIGGTAINIGERWTLILGVVFIIIVLIFPQGIVGTLQTRWRAWRFKRQLKGL
jgi:branched-chain amino acid transport system permease protein